ncbi:protein kinase [bacterium]|nr:protein kinase [bacterium]
MKQNVLYLAKSNVYNLAYIDLLQKSGYKLQRWEVGSPSQDTYKVVIIDSDFFLPEKLWEKIIELKKITNVLIVIVPNDKVTEFSVKVLELGANDAIVNTATPQEFLARLNTALKIVGEDIPKYGKDENIQDIGIGDTIAHYRLDNVLGIGGMGVVYEAVDVNLDRKVAIKVLSQDADLKPIHVKRFLREAEIMAHLQVPEVVRIFDIGREPVKYIVMEIVSGVDLENMLIEKLFTPKETVEIILSVALALHKIHEAGVIHRDLKPSNILIDQSGRIRIFDFGISKLLDAELTLTKPGTSMGTPAYMAPEQIDGNIGVIDRRTDIYALGLTAYEMITGKLPYDEKKDEDEGLWETLKEIVFGNPLTLQKYRPDIDPELDKIIKKATEKKSSRRYQTMLEMAQDLQKLDLSLASYGTRGEISQIHHT